jgi:hypothetical protein
MTLTGSPGHARDAAAARRHRLKWMRC